MICEEKYSNNSIRFLKVGKLRNENESIFRYIFRIGRQRKGGTYINDPYFCS